MLTFPVNYLLQNQGVSLRSILSGSFCIYLQKIDAENRSAVALFPLKLSWANSFPIMGPLCPYLTWLYLNYVL